MDNPEYTALMQKIIANPADDLPRLVMADWLDDYGQPEHASFIRVQCEIPNCTDTHRLIHLNTLQLVLSYNLYNWYPRIHGFYHLLGDDTRTRKLRYTNLLTVKRGFFAIAQVTMRAWDRYGSLLVRTHPIEKVYSQYSGKFTTDSSNNLSNYLIRKAWGENNVMV